MLCDACGDGWTMAKGQCIGTAPSNSSTVVCDAPYDTAIDRSPKALTIFVNDSVECSNFATCELCTTKAAHCQFCGIACIRVNTSCPALPNVAFGESSKCGEPVTAVCPVNQSCNSCRQWPMCQHCEGSGCIDQALVCPGGIAVSSGGTCPIRIAHGAVSNVTLAANMTRSVVVVLNADSFRVSVAPASLSAVTGSVNGAQLTVDARALDTGPLGAEADIVAPLFASLGTSLSNVTALRVVAPDCLLVSNTTLGVVDQLIVVLFHVSMRTACILASQPPRSPVVDTELTSTIAEQSTSTEPTITSSSLSTSQLTLTQSSAQLAVSNQSTIADWTTAATPGDDKGPTWILPVAVTVSALVLLAGAGVAALLWKRRHTDNNQGADGYGARRGVCRHTNRARVRNCQLLDVADCVTAAIASRAFGRARDSLKEHESLLRHDAQVSSALRSCSCACAAVIYRSAQLLRPIRADPPRIWVEKEEKMTLRYKTMPISSGLPWAIRVTAHCGKQKPPQGSGFCVIARKKTKMGKAVLTLDCMRTYPTRVSRAS
jgi:hypothetical protein